MHSTRPAALLAAAFTLLLATPARATERGAHPSPCANRLCTRYVPHTPSCWRFAGRVHVARCFIARAARHYRQSRREAFYVAWRESRYHWRITNPSSGTAGLYQFARVTWNHTPYRRHSPYSPRWASLAAMWLWAHGGYYHWRA